MKINFLTLRYCWAIALTNSVPLSDCLVIRFLSRNKYFNAVVMEVPDLSFSGSSKHTVKIG